MCVPLRVFVSAVNPNGVLRVIDVVDQARAERLARAPNAEVTRRHKDKAIVEIHLRSFGDDSRQVGRAGNPLKYSRFVRQESEHDPTGMWTLKHLADDTGDIFGAVVNECAGRAA